MKKPLWGCRLLATSISIMMCCSGVQGQTIAQPVKIGVMTDMSSLFSDIGGEGSVVAAKMAIEDFGGRVLGKPIELISADHQNKPDVAANLAREWYDKTRLVQLLTYCHQV